MASVLIKILPSEQVYECIAYLLLSKFDFLQRKFIKELIPIHNLWIFFTFMVSTVKLYCLSSSVYMHAKVVFPECIYENKRHIYFGIGTSFKIAIEITKYSKLCSRTMNWKSLSSHYHRRWLSSQSKDFLYSAIHLWWNRFF